MFSQISEGLSPAEDDEDDDLQKENDDPVIRGETTASFQSFLSLRKQLRKSIFKREEVKGIRFVYLCKNIKPFQVM